MELIEEMNQGRMVDGYLICRPDGVNIGIEKITFSFPIEDVEKLDKENLTAEKGESPKYSEIEVQVKDRKVFVTYPLAQLYKGFTLPTDTEHDETFIMMMMRYNLGEKKGCLIKSFDNMEIEKLHLIQAVKIEGDPQEIFQLQKWIYGKYNGEYPKFEECVDSISGGRIIQKLKIFSPADKSHWKSLAADEYQFEFSVVLENVQSVKQCFGENKFEALTEGSLKKVMRDNAVSFFSSLGYIHPLMRLLKCTDEIKADIGSLWNCAVSMSNAEFLDEDEPDENSFNSVDRFSQNLRNLHEFRSFIYYLTRGLVDSEGVSISLLKSVEKLGKKLIGPEFVIELRD
ncbi:hypothetical protein [Leptospira licerasiae]|uniref:hypothetical protein n=1 Tax=Leptospira licerasiae TaxID=447106 RepID=UPI00301633DA